MAVLKICDIGLNPASSNAFQSMLNIVATRAAATWRMAPIEKADVLLAHVDSDPAVMSQWNSSGKPMILVIEDRGSWPTAPFVLRHPFRVMQLLTILDEVSAALAGKGHAAPVREGRAGWAPAESLRRIINNPGERNTYMARCADGSRIWLSDQQAQCSPATLARIRSGQLQPGVFQASHELQDADYVAFPVSDLAWSVGMQTPSELAPWLKADGSYRLRRWPDFGRIRVEPEVIELAADLAAQARTPAELASRPGRDAALVHRFLAATSLGGHLQLATVDAKAPAPRRGISGLTRFVADLCRNLRRVA